MLVLVRNLKPGVTVLSDLDKINLEWQGSGDPNGGDVQPVPPEVLDKVEFARAVRNGILEVVDPSEETQAILERQAAAYNAARQASADAAKVTIDRQANRDFVTIPCIGPAPRGTGNCDLPVAVPERKQDEVPPLCSQHSSFANQCIQIETDKMEEKGDPPQLVSVKKWVRVTLADRQTQMGV